MINERMQKEINEQINAEFWSGYLYLSMSAWFTQHNLPGFANWMYIQYQEEFTHGMKMYRYIHERGGEVTLKPIAKVDTNWKDGVAIFKQTLEHERKVTSLINKLMDTAHEIRDYATINFLNWYVDEQVEEEANAEELLGKLQMIGKDTAALYNLDKELSARVFVDSTLSAEE
ncbi:MAG: ferritin [Bacteroidales bacterium]|nr:ferritin [Bacteroidales bacterium]MCR5114432.1 ferritin [Bacteroidales bacterium]